jgi:hypothetical protein
MSALSAQPSSVIDLDVTSFVLDVVRGRVSAAAAHIENSITDGQIERTTDGASTLSVTVHDPRRALLKSGIFSYAVDVRLDSMYFRLVQVQKQDVSIMLTFEDREVALLREHSGPRKASRSSMTRAEFALSLVREVHPTIPFYCPELHTRQPVAGAGDKRKATKTLPYQFKRGGVAGQIETSWDALQRLAGEVNWRCFVSAGTLYFVSDEDLLKLAPRMTLSESTPGVTTIDFDIDNGKVKSEVTVLARAARWYAAPGDVVELQDVGPADGLWLVHDIRRSLYLADATILLKRPTNPLPEPASTSALSISTATRAGAAAKGITGVVASAYQAAQAINDKRYPYVWGGGHGAAGVPSGGISGGEGGGIGLTGFDCSGSVCAVLAGGGLGFRPGGPVDTSGTLESWGVAGPGQQLTVYCNAVHTFIVFNTANGLQHFGTGDWGKGWDGPGFNPNLHPTAGFTARHWPGT